MGLKFKGPGADKYLGEKTQVNEDSIPMTSDIRSRIDPINPMVTEVLPNPRSRKRQNPPNFAKKKKDKERRLVEDEKGPLPRGPREDIDRYV